MTDENATQTNNGSRGQSTRSVNARTTRAQEPKPSSRYVPAIDGLRAFSVLAVIAYHMNLDWAPGGLMGVTVFFVISGYLINGLLVAEHDRTGSISLVDFWIRRARRILPAVLVAIGGTVALCALISPALLEKARPDIVPSLFFYNNWWQIFHDISYFEAAGAPSPLTHYWSLAIEEQFYLVWPILLMILLRCKLGKKPIAVILIVLAVASGVEMALLYDPHGDPSRVYYGTDTRAMSLLIGAWLAIAWPSAAFGVKRGRDNVQTRLRGNVDGHVYVREVVPVKVAPAERFRQFAINIGGVAALAGLIVIVCTTNGFSAFPYLGGIALTSALSALLIAALVMPGSWVSRLMGIRPLVWIGKRSYSMYLWHFPIILLTSKIGLPIEIPFWVNIAQLVVILAIADLSYRFVEEPIRRGGTRQGRHSVKAEYAVPTAAKVRGAITTVVVSGLFVGAVIGLAIVQPPEEVSRARGAVANITMEIRPTIIKEVAAEKRRQQKKQEVARKKAAKDAYEELFMTRHVNAAGKDIYEPLLIGDSVPAGAFDQFYATFPNGHSDAVVGRYIWESTYRDYLESDQVGTYVIFCLGTNSGVLDEEIDELLAPVSNDKKVILVNTRSTYFDWDDITNAAIDRAKERHPNIVAVVDWYSASANHAEYFIYDGTHLLPEGAEAYISLLEDTIKRSMGVK